MSLSPRIVAVIDGEEAPNGNSYCDVYCKRSTPPARPLGPEPLERERDGNPMQGVMVALAFTLGLPILFAIANLIGDLLCGTWGCSK